MKKLITLLLTLIMVFSMLPLQTAFAADDSDENLALGKPVTAKDTRSGYDPQSVVDGNRKSMWAGNSGVDGNWVMVDLEDNYILTSVIIQPRSDSDTTYYRGNLHVQISSTPDFSTYETIFSNVYTSGGQSSNIPPFGEPVEIKINSTKTYRYVRVIRMDKNTFGLNEIEAYGYQFDPNQVSIGKDVAGTQYEGPVTLLTNLKMVELKKPLEDLYGVNTLLSRAETAEMMVKAFSAGTSFSGGIPFNDVKENDSFYQAVMTAYYLGYVTGDNDTSFRPKDYVTLTEFLFMTLRAIGYDDVIQKVMANDPGKVINLAKELNLLKNLQDVDFNAPVTRGDLAIIFYNALLAPSAKLQSMMDEYLFFDEGADMLRSRFNIMLTTGIVEENRMTTIDGDAKSNKQAARLGNQKFIDPNGVLDNFLGNSVVVATSVDEPETILFGWKTQKDEEVVLPAGLLTSSKSDIQNNCIKAIADDGKEETYDLDDNFYVIKNNQASPFWKEEDLMLSNGQLRLLDNDRDGFYEIVFIEAFSLHYLISSYYDDNTLTFIDDEGVNKTIERDTLVVTNGNGNSVKLKNLAFGTLIKFFDGGDAYSKIVLYDTPVTGKLSMLSDKEAAIDGTTYPLSAVYQTSVKDSVNTGEPVIAFADENGEILWLKRDTDAINAGWTIAFSQAVAIGQGMEGKVGFRLFTAGDKWEELYVADRIVVDGKTMDKGDFADLVRGSAKGRFTEVLVRYKKDSANQIKEIDTLTEGSTFIESGEVGNWVYTKTSEAFWEGNKVKLPAKANTPLFQIPKVGGEVAKGGSYDSQYNMTTLGNVVVTHNPTQTTGLIPYMVADSVYPVCFVRVNSVSAAGGTDTYIYNSHMPYLLVEKVVTTVTEEGAVALQISGQGITSAGVTGSVSILADPNLIMKETGLLYQNHPEVLDVDVQKDYSGMILRAEFDKLSAEEQAVYKTLVTDIGFGDLIRYRPAVPTVYAVERIFDYEGTLPMASSKNEQAVWYTSGKNHGHYHVHYRYQLGQVTDIDKDFITVETLYGDKEYYSKTAFTSGYLCETVGRTQKLTKISDLERFIGDSYRVMLYSYNGGPKTVIVYPY